MKTLTKPQQRALVALCLMAGRGKGVRHWRGTEAGSGYFTRWEMGRAARRTTGFPQATLHALWRAGLVAPESDLTVELVRGGVCRCGCDRWAPTEAGRQLAATWNVRWVEEDKDRAIW